MRIAVIIEKSLKLVGEQLLQSDPFADGFEIRLDALEKLDVSSLRSLMTDYCEKPIIFTLRRKDQGGFFQGTEKQRQEQILELIALEPQYFDLEYDLPNDWIIDLKKKFSKTKIIGSFHGMQCQAISQEYLEELFETELANKPFDVYKLVVPAQNSLDVIQVMRFTKAQKIAGNHLLSCMCTGKSGELSRVLAKACGSFMVYGYVGKKRVQGQVSLQDLVGIYHIPKGEDNRKIYALLGDPIKQSIGHIYHNKIFQNKSLYVRISLSKEILGPFFQQLDGLLDIDGFSITTPLKEHAFSVANRVSSDAQSIEGINTFWLDNENEWVGENTDGKGALDAISQTFSIVIGMRIAIVGTGPSARSIAFEAVKRGCEVTLYSRDPKQSLKKIKFSGVTVKELEKMSSEDVHDFFIDATGSGIRDIPSGYSEHQIPASKGYMHLSIPSKETWLFKEIEKRKQAKWVRGEEMFLSQAEFQQQLWSKGN